MNFNNLNPSYMITIAIDGYSSSGKSTMARELARTIGYRYIDSGAMYRAVTLYAMNNGMTDPTKEYVDIAALTEALPDINIDFAPAAPGQTQHTLLNGNDVEDRIRQMDVSAMVSLVAVIPAVRHALVEMQRRMGQEKGIVMDGRDIGTTVFPHAEMKVFVNAPASTRAMRRFNELKQKGIAASYEEVLANVVHRDHIDENREESPLRRADDAVTLDNSCMTPEQQNQWLLNLYRSIIESIAR